ncbi:MAG: NADH:flavin oxidoreductase [Bdellovibrionota bacterium]
MINLHSNIKITNEFKIKNRIVVPPMASATADQNGFVTKQTLEHYKRLTNSKAGLIMVEYTYINPAGKSEPNQLGILSDLHIEGLKNLANVIHHQGSASGIQLTHAGGKSNRSLTDGSLISPSGIAVPVKDRQMQEPDTASSEDISELKNSFLNAAIRAYTAGFNIIELHCAHGYGLNQWLSPLTNKRHDKYGGNNDNRSRLLYEVVKLIKENLPKSILSVRIPGMDHIPGGLAYQDTIKIIQNLESLDVNIINVSSGIGGWRRPKNRMGEGYLVADAAIIQKNTSLPVIGVGGIKSAEFINDCLQQKKISLAAVGRSILENPQWGPNIGLN